MIKKAGLIFLLLCSAKVGSQNSAVAVADSLYQLANYTEAINFYAKAPSSQSSLQIARAYNAIGNYDKAIKQYDDLLAREPAMLIAAYELGKLYVKIKSFEKAQDIFRMLLKKDDVNPQYHYFLGQILKELIRSDESLQAFRNAITIDSTHLKSIHAIGKYYLLNREIDSVVKYADKGLSFYPNSIELINIKALALFNDRDFGRALPLFERLIELKQEKEYIYEKLGQCYFTVGEYEKAIITYEEALKFDDENAKVLNLIGHVYWKQKEYDKAIKYIQKSIEVQQVFFDSEYMTLGRIYLDLKQVKNALNHYELAFKEDPENPLIYYQICFLANNYYKDPKVKLRYFETYQNKFDKKLKGFDDFIAKRISELKTEIHLAEE